MGYRNSQLLLSLHEMLMLEIFHNIRLKMDSYLPPPCIFSQYLLLYLRVSLLLKENHIPDLSILFILRSVKKGSAHLESSFQKNERMKVKDGNHFPGGSAVKNLRVNARDMGVPSLGLEDPLEEEMATHSSVLAWENPMDRGAWWATVHGVRKNQTQLSDLTWITFRICTSLTDTVTNLSLFPLPLIFPLSLFLSFPSSIVCDLFILCHYPFVSNRVFASRK